MPARLVRGVLHIVMGDGFFQPPQHIVELVERLIVNDQFAGAAVKSDRHFETEQIG